MAFQPGDLVHVYNSKMNGEPLYEGQAKVLSATGVPDQYKVRFLMAGEKYLRFVYAGECQSDPKAFLAKLQAEWKERWVGAEGPLSPVSDILPKP